MAYKERFDKDNFIKNLLLDNLLLVDIYNRAKKLHIDSEARRGADSGRTEKFSSNRRGFPEDSTLDRKRRRKFVKSLACAEISETD